MQASCFLPNFVEISFKKLLNFLQISFKSLRYFGCSVGVLASHVANQYSLKGKIIAGFLFSACNLHFISSFFASITLLRLGNLS